MGGGKHHLNVEIRNQTAGNKGSFGTNAANKSSGDEFRDSESLSEFPLRAVAVIVQ